MKNPWIILILFIACRTDPKTDPDTLSGASPKYETYDYSGFTKEEIYSFHRHLLEGGSRYRQGGDLSRFYFLNFSEIETHFLIPRSDVPKLSKKRPRKM